MTDAVVAGSRGFALALLGPLTERIGTRPRIASDPTQVLALCRGPGGLAVVEFQGEDTLRAIKNLVLEGGGLRIVAAVPEALAAAEGPLRALGVHLVRWDGRPDGVLAALAPRPAAAPAGAAAPPPASVSGDAPSRTAPGRSIAGSTPATPRAPASRAETAPAPVARPRPPSPQGARPPPAPPPPKAAPAAASRASPAAAPQASAPAPSASSRPDGVAFPAASASQAPTAGALFDDLGDDFDVDLDEGTPLRAPPPAAAPPAAVPSAAAPSAAGPWPLGAPDTIEAADALGRALAGEAGEAGTALGVAAVVAASLSELERAVFSGAPQPVDPEPIRRAAVMRVRVSAALATAPAPGGAVDAGAVSAFLADIDALLSDVNTLAAGCPAELQPSLEAVRNALVKEAIDFSEAAQRALPAGGAVEPVVVRARAAPGARVLSVDSKLEREIAAAESHRRNRALLALAAALAVGLAFHGYRYWAKRGQADEVPTRAGAPASATIVQGPTGAEPAVVRTKDGSAFKADELQRLRDAEALRGNTVRELGPGAVLIVPGDHGAGRDAPAAGR